MAEASRLGFILQEQEEARVVPPGGTLTDAEEGTYDATYYEGMSGLAFDQQEMRSDDRVEGFGIHPDYNVGSRVQYRDVRPEGVRRGQRIPEGNWIDGVVNEVILRSEGTVYDVRTLPQGHPLAVEDDGHLVSEYQLRLAKDEDDLELALNQALNQADERERKVFGTNTAHARRFREQFEDGTISHEELMTLSSLRTNFIDASQLSLEDQYEVLQKRDHGFTQQHVRGLLNYLRKTMGVKEPNFGKTNSSETFLVNRINALEKTVKQFVAKSEMQEDLKIIVERRGVQGSMSQILDLQGYKDELMRNAKRILDFDENDIEDVDLLSYESRFYEMLDFESQVTYEEGAAIVDMAPKSDNLETMMVLFIRHLCGDMPALLQKGYIRHEKPVISIGSGTDQDVSMETFLNGLSYGENQALLYGESGETENKYVERILCDNANLPYSNIILELQLMNKLCFSGINPMIWANTVNITFCGGAIIIFNHWISSKNKEQVSLKVVKRLLIPGRNKRVTMNDRNKTIKVQVSATEVHEILMRKKAIMKQEEANEERRKEIIEAMDDGLGN